MKTTQLLPGAAKHTHMGARMIPRGATCVQSHPDVWRQNVYPVEVQPDSYHDNRRPFGGLNLFYDILCAYGSYFLLVLGVPTTTRARWAITSCSALYTTFPVMGYHWVLTKGGGPVLMEFLWLLWHGISFALWWLGPRCGPLDSLKPLNWSRDPGSLGTCRIFFWWSTPWWFSGLIAYVFQGVTIFSGNFCFLIPPFLPAWGGERGPTDTDGTCVVVACFDMAVQLHQVLALQGLCNHLPRNFFQSGSLKYWLLLVACTVLA